MKTTEVFIDQVLIGFVVLAIFILPFSDWFKVDAAQGAVLAGTAYLLGILFDRFANTLLSGLEQRHRLHYAWKPPSDEGDPFPLHYAWKLPSDEGDPFPEDQLIANVLRTDGSAAEWLNYLRSRVRLSRALAAFLPALTIAFGLRLLDDPELSLQILVLVSAVYLAGFGAFWSKWQWLDLPKTHERLSKTHAKKHPQATREGCSCRVCIRDPALLVLAAPFVMLFVLALCGGSRRSQFVLIGFSGLALTIVALLTWLKIRETLMDFIRSMDRGEGHKRAPPTAPSLAHEGPA